MNSYSSSRDYRAREREDRYSGRRDDREWDRGDRAERGGGDRGDRRRRDFDDRPRRDLFDDRRSGRGGGDRGGGDRGGGDRAGGDRAGGDRADRGDRAERGDRGDRERRERKRSATPPRRKEPTPDLTDVPSVLTRKRRLTQWDIKPPGYENVTAEQAKLSGMYLKLMGHLNLTNMIRDVPSSRSSSSAADGPQPYEGLLEPSYR